MYKVNKFGDIIEYKNNGKYYIDTEKHLVDIMKMSDGTVARIIKIKYCAENGEMVDQFKLVLDPSGVNLDSWKPIKFITNHIIKANYEYYYILSGKIYEMSYLFKDRLKIFDIILGSMITNDKLYVLLFNSTSNEVMIYLDYDSHTFECKIQKLTDNCNMIIHEDFSSLIIDGKSYNVRYLPKNIVSLHVKKNKLIIKTDNHSYKVIRPSVFIDLHRV